VSACVSGLMIGLEYNGETVCSICQQVVENQVTDWQRSVYISPDPTTAARQIEAFYSVADMMMAV